MMINADKPHLWKADIAASVDRFNQWFMRVAPEAFRSTRIKTTHHVKSALLATNDLRNLNVDALKSKSKRAADTSNVHSAAVGGGPANWVG
jgi:type II restriction enzyme